MTPPKISLVAVFVAALAAFFLGFLWYAPPLFGGLWMQLHGYTPEGMAAMKPGLAMTYGLSFLCQVVIAAVLALLLIRTGGVGALAGARLGTLCWLGFAATTGFTSILFSAEPFPLYLIDGGYQLAYFAVMGAIVGAWRGRSR